MAQVVFLCHGVAGKLGFDFDSPVFAFGDDVGRFDGADGHRAADARFHAARHGGAFFHRDAAEQGGVEVVAVAHAVVVEPDIDRLLRAVQRYGDTALAGDAAYVGRNRPAGGAGVHVVHAV